MISPLARLHPVKCGCVNCLDAFLVALHEQQTDQILLAVLRTAMAERPKRQEFLRAEPAWVHYEREQMLAAVNIARSRLNKKPLGLDRVIAAEETSYGPRYAERFSRACAELVTE